MKLVGERRAIAAAVFAFFAFIWFGNALNGPPQVANVAFALMGAYTLAFFGLVAGYFWARWYSIGLGLFGIILAIVLMYQMRALEPLGLFIGGTHLAGVLMLWGDAMSEPFDGQKAWRDKYHMDDNAVQRLGRSVIRAGVMLPFILIYAFGPKPEGEFLGFLSLGLVLVGMGGLARMKTWGLVAIGGAGMLMIGQGFTSVSSYFLPHIPGIAIGAGLIAAASPFARQMGRVLTSKHA